MMESLYLRINQYRSDFKPGTIDPNKYVDDTAHEFSGYYNPQEIQDLFERVNLDNRKMAFCVYVSGTYEPIKTLIKRFNINQDTYYDWLHNPKIQECIRVLKKNRRLKLMGEDYTLRNAWYQQVMDMFAINTTNANLATKKELAIMVYKILEGEKPSNSRSLYIEMTDNEPSNMPNFERDVTPKGLGEVTPTDVLALKRQLLEEVEELEILRRKESDE